MVAGKTLMSIKVTVIFNVLVGSITLLDSSSMGWWVDNARPLMAPQISIMEINITDTTRNMRYSNIVLVGVIIFSY